MVSGGTDNHLFLVDLVDKNLTGKEADAALGRANITVNKNSVPNDPKSPFVTSGIRVGLRRLRVAASKKQKRKNWLAGCVTCWTASMMKPLSSASKVKFSTSAHVTRFTHKRNGDLLTMCSLFMLDAA
ncbi:hypothetical protein ACVXG8_20505 [Escherichia coli]